jgi:hypothetical protein
MPYGKEASVMDCILCQEQIEEGDEDLVWVSLDVSTQRCLVHIECFDALKLKVEEIRIEHDDRGRDE